MTLRVGYIGVGGISRRHLGNAAAREDVEIVGHADIRPERARAAAAKYGGNAYDHCTRLLDTEKPDAVVICTPPDAHGDIEEACAERGVPFFVEKPVAVSLDLAARAKRAVDRVGLITQVGYMYRFSHGVQKARELLAGRRVAMVQQHFYMPGLPPPEWWPYLERSGGQLTEQATHMLDLGRFLCGDVVAVTGVQARVRDWRPRPDTPEPGGLRWTADPFTIPDTTALTLQYACGALGTLSCSMVPGTAWDNGFRIVAEGLIITIDGGNVSWRGQEEGSAAAGENWQSYVLYDFFDAVIEGRPAQVPYDEGVRSLAISLAGHAAARGGTPVNPLDLIRDLGL